MNTYTTLVVHIVHKGTGLAIDLEEDNKHLILKGVNNSESQHWIAQKTNWGSYIFINRKNGKALDCRLHAKTEPVNHSMSQEWLCNPEGVLRNLKKNVVLSVQKKHVILSDSVTTSTLNEQFCLQVCDKEDSRKRAMNCH